ncbi:MAG: histidine phosphatase family protein [Gammaproteobacteria bacterium]|nr:histidine phosphatase family protein [Gammaproteobacteria bacterium]
MATTTRLVLMRHAKSDWFAGAGDDFTRPLSERGLRDARHMGRWLKDSGYLPAVILCSPARRTRQTLERMGEDLELDLAARATYPEELYHAGLPTLKAVLKRQGEQREVMLVGHNPGLEELVAWLLDARRPLPQHAKSFPTAAVYVLDLPDGWADPRAGSARLVAHQRPKSLSREA